MDVPYYDSNYGNGIRTFGDNQGLLGAVKKSSLKNVTQIKANKKRLV